MSTWWNRCDRLVAPVGAGRLDQLLAPQPFEDGVEPVRPIVRHELSQRAEAELGARRPTPARAPPLVGGEPLDAGGEQRLDRRRHLDGVGVDRPAPSESSSRRRMTPSSTSMRTSSRTNSGLPSVERGQPVDQLGRAGASVPSSPAASASVADGVEAVERRRPRPPADRARSSAGRTSRSSGRASPTSSTGAAVDPLGEVLEQVEQQGSAHWMSSITNTSGRWRPRATRPGGGPPRTSPRSSGLARRRRGRRARRRPRARVGVAPPTSSARWRRGRVERRRRRPGRPRSRSSSTTGAKVAAPARSQRISNDVAPRCRRRSPSSRDSRVLPTPGEPSTVTSRARRRGRASSNTAAAGPSLGVTADERRRRLRRLLGARSSRHELEDRDRLGSPGDGDLAERLVARRAAGEPPRLLADEHLARAARLLEPGGDVERVADEVGVAVADHDLAGVDADPQVERLAVAFGHVGGERHRSRAGGRRRRRPHGAASSSATSGMPNSAIIPSPMNLATVPPWASITAWSSAW